MSALLRAHIRRARSYGAGDSVRVTLAKVATERCTAVQYAVLCYPLWRIIRSDNRTAFAVWGGRYLCKRPLSGKEEEAALCFYRSTTAYMFCQCCIAHACIHRSLSDACSAQSSINYNMKTGMHLRTTLASMLILNIYMQVYVTCIRCLFRMILMSGNLDTRQGSPYTISFDYGHTEMA